MNDTFRSAMLLFGVVAFLGGLYSTVVLASAVLTSPGLLMRFIAWPSVLIAGIVFVCLAARGYRRVRLGIALVAVSTIFVLGMAVLPVPIGFFASAILSVVVLWAASQRWARQA